MEFAENKSAESVQHDSCPRLQYQWGKQEGDQNFKVGRLGGSVH